MTVRTLSKLILSMIWIFSSASVAFASDVESACRAAKLNFVQLKYRNGTENRNAIRLANLGNSAVAKFLTESAKQNAISQNEMEKLAKEANQKFTLDSSDKTAFLQFSTVEEKLKHPNDYRKALINAVSKFVPKTFLGLDWFLNFKAPSVHSTSVEPAQKSLGELYGAVFKARLESDGLYSLKIIFSNNASEPIPYLISLVVHEVQHAFSFSELSKMPTGRKKMEAMLIDEAKAFDLQMQVYVAIAKANPALFCNWIYPTWAYGDILVPLSWTMASMEKQMLSGELLLNYAKQGQFENSPFLLNADKTALRAEMRESISKLNLKYVR